MAPWLKTLTTAAGLGAVLLAAFIVVRITGCFDSHVESERVTTLAAYPSGIFYRTNRTVFEVTATFEIAGCRSVNIDPILEGDPATGGKRAYRLVDLKVTDPAVTVRLEVDPAQLWRIMPATIEGAWWSTTFAATLDAQGRLREVDAASTAVKPGDIVAPISTAIATLAPSSAAPIDVPTAAAAAPAADDATFCGHGIHDALARRQAIEDRLARNPPPNVAAVLESELGKTLEVLRKTVAVVLVPRRPPSVINFATATAEDLQPHGLAYRFDPETLFEHAAGADLRKELKRRGFEFRILAQPAPGGPDQNKVKGIVHRIPAQTHWVVCNVRAN